MIPMRGARAAVVLAAVGIAATGCRSRGSASQGVDSDARAPAPTSAAPTVPPVPDREFLVAHEHAASVAFVGTSDLSTIATVETGPEPHGIALDPRRRRAYVSSYGSLDGERAVTVVDLATRRAAGSLSLRHCGRPHGLAIDALGQLWVTCEDDDSLAVVDPESGTELRRERLDAKRTHMVTAVRNGEVLVASHLGSPFLSLFDPAWAGERARLGLPHGTEMIAEAADGSLWATSPGHGKLLHLALDAEAGAPARWRSAASLVVGDTPIHVAVSDDGVVVHVAADGVLAVVDPTSAALTRKLPLDAMGGDVVRLGPKLYAVSDAMKSRLLLVDLASGHVLRGRTIPGGASHLALLPEGGTGAR